MRSRIGANVIDENLIFGVIGVADTITDLTTSIVAIESG